MFALITFLTALLPSQQADLIFHGGKIVTVDSKFTVHQALASKNGVIKESDISHINSLYDGKFLYQFILSIDNSNESIDTIFLSKQL